MTQILAAWSDGDGEASERLWPIVYEELRTLATGYLRQERDGHTLETGDLVHEAYFRLVDQSRVSWQSRSHFYGIAAQTMRRILVDHARKHLSAKRGEGKSAPLEDAPLTLDEPAPELIALDDALSALAGFAPRQAKIVEMRFFGGSTAEEIGHALDISVPTVTREWRVARAWLYRCIRGEEDDDS